MIDEMKLKDSLDATAFEIRKVAEHMVRSLSNADLLVAGRIVGEWSARNTSAHAYYARDVLGRAIEAESWRRSPKAQGDVMYCERCDGCGWYEGGRALRTTCEDCGGTGIARRASAESISIGPLSDAVAEND